MRIKYLAPIIISVVMGGCAEESAVAPLVPIPPVEVLTGVFEGRIPSGGEIDQKTKVRLILMHDAATGTPSTASVEWLPVGTAQDVRHIHQGPWRIQTGIPSFPDAVGYHLDGAPEGFAGYMKVGNDLLLMLDGSLNLRIGNASWSYTLSRTM